MEIFISTIIPTIGRATLGRAVQSVLSQQLQQARFEVIIVNDSGKSLPTADWYKAPNIHIVNTNRHERSVARNTGATLARGRYLHFLDDDDWMLPGAFQHFWELAQQQPSVMLYGGYRFAYTDGSTIEECHPNESGNCFIRFMSGEWQPLQASLFDSKIFHLLGGFTSLETLRGGDEDVDLTRRVSLEHDITGIRDLTAVIRLDREQSTTNYSNLQEQSRQSRELVLNMPHAFARLRHSAQGRTGHLEYWHGRLTWIYLGSILWNFQQINISIAFSRFASFLASLLVSFRFWLSPKFWRGATRPHQAKGWLVNET